MTRVAGTLQCEDNITPNAGDGGSSEPLVSVIIPAFQCAQYIVHCLTWLPSRTRGLLLN